MLLCAARLLIGAVRFGRWRGLLGPVDPGNDTTAAPAFARADRHIARTVDRVACGLKSGIDAHRSRSAAQKNHAILTLP